MKNLLTILLILLPFSAHAWGVVVSSGGVAAAGGGVSWGDAPPSKNVWYSCSPFGTGDIKTGSPTITIETGGKATLSVAQTGNIGQGDRVTYDTSSVAYIAKVVNSSHFYLVTASGGTPSNVTGKTVNSIAHVWASLSDAEDHADDAAYLNNADLTEADVVLNICCYYDHDDQTADTTAVTIDGYTTDSTRYINIYTPTGGTQSINSQRHAGAWSASKYRLSHIGGNNAILISDAVVKIDGLQILDGTTSSFCGGIFLNDAGNTYDVSVRNCIVRCNDITTVGAFGIKAVSAAASSKIQIENCIVYGYDGDPDQVGIRCSGANFTVSVYNSVISSCYNGVSQGAGTLVVRNCAVFNNTYDFGGTITISYCASDAGDGTNAVDISPGATETTEWAKAFTDYANGDFSIKGTSSVLYNAGADLSASMDSVDIIGTSRPQSTSWDIGAFEYVSE